MTMAAGVQAAEAAPAQTGTITPPPAPAAKAPRTTSGGGSGGSSRIDKVREARMKGYEGDSCGECGNFTLVRNGTCMKCDTCGSTSGCS